MKSPDHKRPASRAVAPDTLSRNHTAASELMGALILLGFVVAAFAVIAVMIFSQPPPQKIPSFSALVTNQSCIISLYHDGGDTLQRQSMKILVDSNDRTADFRMRNKADVSPTWETGDTLVYTPSTCSAFPGRVDVVYENANVVLSKVFRDSAITTATPTPTATPLLPPVAGFTGNPLSGPSPLLVQFTDTSTNNPTSWSWIYRWGSSFVLFSTAQNPTFSFTDEGTYDISLTATNAAGSTSITRSSYITVSPPLPAPTFISIAPSTGPTSGGTTVTITGTDLTGATAVTFDGTAATAFSVDSATQITATTPAHAAGAVDVTVTTPGGTATGTGAYTYVALTVTARSNATLNRGWPGYELITGTSFVSGATSVLNTTTGSSIASTTCDVRSSTLMFCSYNLLGAPVSASYRVAVVNPDGQSGLMTTNLVSVASPAPTLSGSSPPSAPRGWPVSVTLTGTQFQPGATVNMTRGGVVIDAYDVVVVSPTSITGKFNLVGATAANDWAIRVTNPDLISSGSRAFTVTKTVTVTSITPVSGKRGTTVTITTIEGTGFQPGVTEVRFSRNTGTQNQILLTNINVQSSTRISGTLVIPSGQTVQTLYVRVTNADATTGISGSRIFSVTA